MMIKSIRSKLYTIGEVEIMPYSALKGDILSASYNYGHMSDPVVKAAIIILRKVYGWSFTERYALEPVFHGPKT